jgi:hypothetical protein
LDDLDDVEAGGKRAKKHFWLIVFFAFFFMLMNLCIVFVLQVSYSFEFLFCDLWDE